MQAVEKRKRAGSSTPRRIIVAHFSGGRGPSSGCARRSWPCLALNTDGGSRVLEESSCKDPEQGQHEAHFLSRPETFFSAGELERASNYFRKILASTRATSKALV